MPVTNITASKSRRRWEKLHEKYKAVVAENDRLRGALDELNADVEDLLSDAGQNGIEAAKSHTIRAQQASIRRLKAQRDQSIPEIFEGTQSALDSLTRKR